MPSSIASHNNLVSKTVPPVKPNPCNQTPVTVVPVTVALLGGTGLSGRHTFSILHEHPSFTVKAIIGSEASANIPYIETWKKKESALESHHERLGYVSQPPPPHRPVHGENLPVPMTIQTFLQSFSPSTIRYVISTVAPSLGHIESTLSSLNFTVITISPANRSPANTFVLEHKIPRSPLRVYASPNCVACGVAPVLSAICNNAAPKQTVTHVTITTIQSLTGRGDSPYPSSLCINNILPVGQIEETETYLKSELSGLFSSSSSDPPEFDVRCYRGGALRGHVIDLRVSLSDQQPRQAKLTASTVVSWLESFDPLSSYHASASFSSFHFTGSSPPILVSPSPTGVLQSSVTGMQIVVSNVDVSDSGCIRCTIVVDNLMKGAAGAAVQIMEYVEFHDHLRPKN
ncbi:hypothetical protein TrVE_jg10747 [Triparma verrucosa]|uniref:Semialdehyde dehydrogenase NAD-binding domain-containing protein n=1 Tax=Triparma verrucosa TaxID=1606542 RepID=A0A9W7C914_9STRA|nr:hypothetical protein TrVE_jg10747 [Triparma verrucosa]